MVNKALRNFCLIVLLLVAVHIGHAQMLTATPTVPRAHPRVLIMPEDVVALKQKRNTPEFSALWTNIKNSSNAVSLALVYLLDNDVVKGRTAIDKALNELKAEPEKRGIKFFNAVFRGALVYDWCYPLLSSDQKNSFIAEFKRIHSTHSPYWPVNNTYGAITSHNVEGWFWNQLYAGLAIYDENPAIFQKASDTFFQNFQQVRNFFFKSHMHHQGWYFGTRYAHVILATWMYKRLTGKDVFVPDQQYVPYHLLYSMRPDGQIIRTGDVTEDAGLHEFKDVILGLTANYYQDPYLRYAADQGFFGAFPYADFLDFITRNKIIDPKPLHNLPLTKYFPEPVGGEMIARTGWNISKFSNDAVVQMRIGQYYFGNHQHKDFGTFQIYYKGNLAGKSGMYKGTKSEYGTDHWVNYYRSTIANNGLLIYDPNEKYSGGKFLNTAVDGGQRWPLFNEVQPKLLSDLLKPENGYKYADVIAYEFGPDQVTPEFNYISGDLTPGYVYQNGANPDKVKKVTRSMVTFNTGNQDYPCVFVVFDRITSTNANFKKTFLLHSMQQPKVSDKKTIIERGDGQVGKLVSYTLLPEKPVFKTVEGYSINGATFDPGTKASKDFEDLRWRLEVSPAEKNLTDEFLHVMAVMDYGTQDPGAEKFISGNLIGAKILDKIVMFSKDGALLTDASLDIKGEGLFNILLCDVEPGEWILERDGKEEILFASTEGQTLYFKALPGNIRLFHRDSGYARK